MKRQGNSLLIEVQSCTNCHQHSWCTRHDESKYNAFYQKLETQVNSLFPNASIRRNKMSGAQQNKYSGPASADRHIDNSGYDDQYPRFGAFQVSVNGVQIFSKLKSSLWPSIDRITKLIGSFENDLRQGGDGQKYSVNYRLQNDNNFTFVQTYRAELRRKEKRVVFSHEKPATAGSNKNFKSRKLHNSRPKREMITQPSTHSPIINSKKFNVARVRPDSRDEHVHNPSDFSNKDEQLTESKDIQIHKWKNSSQQNTSNKSPIVLKKSKIQQLKRSKMNNKQDKHKTSQDQLNLHNLIDRKMNQGDKNSSLNMDKSSKQIQNKQYKNKNQQKKQDESSNKIEKINGWSEKQPPSEFLLDEMGTKKSNKSTNKLSQRETKRDPSINENLVQNQDYDNQFILEQSDGQGEKKEEDQKQYLKVKQQEKYKSSISSKKSLHIEKTFSEKQLDLKNYHLIYDKIINWQAVYTESQQDYEVYQFVLLEMSKNFKTETQSKNQIESFEEFQQDANLFRVQEQKVQQIKYKQLVYVKYEEIQWTAAYEKNKFNLKNDEKDYSSFCDQIIEQNQIEDQLEMQAKSKLTNANVNSNSKSNAADKLNLTKSNPNLKKEMEEKKQKQLAQHENFFAQQTIKIQKVYQVCENWVGEYKNNQFNLYKEELKPVQVKNIDKNTKVKISEVLEKKQTIIMENLQEEKWTAEYSGTQFLLNKKNKQSSILPSKTTPQKQTKKETKKQTKNQIVDKNPSSSTSKLPPNKQLPKQQQKTFQSPKQLPKAQQIKEEIKQQKLENKLKIAELTTKVEDLPQSDVIPQTINWQCEYKGTEFYLRRQDTKKTGGQKTNSKKNIQTIIKKEIGSTSNLHSNPPPHAKSEKIQKISQKDENTIQWTGSYKNDQFLIQKS